MLLCQPNSLGAAITWGSAESGSSSYLGSVLKVGAALTRGQC
jgi:hypothetical protein